MKLWIQNYYESEYLFKINTSLKSINGINKL